MCGRRPSGADLTCHWLIGLSLTSHSAVLPANQVLFREDLLQIKLKGTEHRSRFSNKYTSFFFLCKAFSTRPIVSLLNVPRTSFPGTKNPRNPPRRSRGDGDLPQLLGVKHQLHVVHDGGDVLQRRALGGERRHTEGVRSSPGGREERHGGVRSSPGGDGGDSTSGPPLDPRSEPRRLPGE